MLGGEKEHKFHIKDAIRGGIEVQALWLGGRGNEESSFFKLNSPVFCIRAVATTVQPLALLLDSFLSPLRMAMPRKPEKAWEAAHFLPTSPEKKPFTL